MIRELIARVTSAGKRAIARVRSALTKGKSSRTIPCPYLAAVLRAGITRVPTQTLRENRLRAHAVHAPVFSLYTFFGLAP